MADVTAALVTLNDIAICGSDGSIMLVASVPIAASPARTPICKMPETGACCGAVSIILLRSAMRASSGSGTIF